MSMPRTAAVLTSSTGVQLTLNPAEWNAQAWKLATDPRPLRTQSDRGRAVSRANRGR